MKGELRMKKVISVLLITIMLCSCVSVCFADGFSVRGGVNFNSTKQEILAYEQSVSSVITINPKGDTFYDYFTDNCIMCDGISYAGYDNCRVIYYFDRNDTLISVLYVVRFFGSDGKKYVPDAYTRLNNALNEKYGPIIENPIDFTKDSKAYGIVEFVKGLDFMGAIADYKQRIFSNTNYYVEIEIANVEYMDTEAEFKYASVHSVSISYTKIENEVVEALYQEAIDAQNALDSDL